MAEAKGNAGSPKPGGNPQTTTENTPRHKLLAMGQTPKDGGKGDPGK